MNAQKPNLAHVYEREIGIYKILAHPARLAILEILREGESCVCHMEAYLGYRQAYLSQQLSILRQAGMIQDRKDGWNVFYHIADQGVFDILTATREVLKIEIQQHHPQKECPCPKCNTGKSES